MKKSKLLTLMGLSTLIGGCSGLIENRPPPPETFNSCYDGEYDNDTRCINETERQLEQAKASVYEVISEITCLIPYKLGEGEEQKTIQIPRTLIRQGSGTLYEDGHFLTAYHVVEPIEEIKNFNWETGKVEVYPVIENKNFIQRDGTQYEIRTILTDEVEEFDYAWMKLLSPAPDLPISTFQFGDTDNVRPGDFTYVIGNMAALGVSVASGEVSRTEQDDYYESDLNDKFLVISNPFGGGDSGGPTYLVKDGKLEYIGMNDMIFLPMDHVGYITKINKILDDSLFQIYINDIQRVEPGLEKLILKLSTHDKED